jgi:hypothetical protein
VEVIKTSFPQHTRVPHSFLFQSCGIYFGYRMLRDEHIMGLQFSDISTAKNGILQQIEINLFGDAPFGAITNNADRLIIMTAIVNQAMNRYAYIALTSDNSWYFDDNNYTDFPVGETDLIAARQDYLLNTSQIEVDQVEILDPTGTIWLSVPQIDERKFAEYKNAESQYMNNTPGQPRVHIKKGNSILLYPIPNYSITLAANGKRGIRVRLKRPPSYFLNTDTTKVPGFNSMHDDYLVDYGTWKYAFSRQMPIAAQYASIVVQWEKEKIPLFYNDRSSEHPDKFLPARKSSR